LAHTPFSFVPSPPLNPSTQAKLAPSHVHNLICWNSQVVRIFFEQSCFIVTFNSKCIRLQEGGRESDGRFRLPKELKTNSERKKMEYLPDEKFVLAVTCNMQFVMLRLNNKAVDIKET
jgi:hypothetical protein